MRDKRASLTDVIRSTYTTCSQLSTRQAIQQPVGITLSLLRDSEMN